MTISFNCEHCGKKVEAPDAAGGKRGRCPYCKGSCFIPAPVTDEDIYDMADDEAPAPTARPEDLALIAEMGGGDAAPPEPLEEKTDLKPEDVYPLVVNYCLAMSESKLEQAESYVAQMKKVRGTARAAVEDFLAEKAKEDALAKLPPPLLKAFLTQLRAAM